MGVMTGLGIINGIDSTTIDPDGTYTREQAAKIIAYMLLGADKAEALSCTKAPFDDVAADHWSAKYIAFCVNEGIIDGMSATTFEPYATLTGYQWAKMLLSAVGFNAKKELTGDEWAIHTGSLAAQTGLFDGDLKGGDHVALQRQQAVLYAFNTLTGIDVVVWSEALGDYIVSYNQGSVNGGIDRFTYEGTLAHNVWKLTSVEGVIYDNEALGAAGTVMSVPTSTGWTVKTLAADTGLDMLGHAARVWYVTNGSVVYTYDLAVSASKFECNDVAAAVAKYSALVGSNHVTTVDAIPYEYAYIVNPAKFGNFDVTADAYLATITAYLESSNSIRLHTSSADWWVDVDDVMTDISDLGVNAEVVVVQTKHDAYYIAPVTTTVGHVTGYNSTTQTVTLSDGTVLEISNLYDDNETPVVGKDYKFTLDTHGDYIRMDVVKPEASIYYFTGAVRWTTPESGILGEGSGAAQAVNVVDGSIEWFDVDRENIVYNSGNKFYEYTGYVDVSVADSSNDYKRVSATDASLTFTATSNTDTGVVYGDSVQFVLASGVGSKLTVDTSNTSIAALLNSKSATEATLTNVYVTTEKNTYGNIQAVSVFSPDAVTVDHVVTGFIYLPEKLDATSTWSITEEQGNDAKVFYYTTEADAAYINGDATALTFLQSTMTAPEYNAGFYEYYTYTSNGKTVYVLSPVSAFATTQGAASTFGGDVYDLISTDTSNGSVWTLVSSGYKFDVTNAKVVDLRSGLSQVTGDHKPDAMKNVFDLNRYNQALADKELDGSNATISVAYYVNNANGLNGTIAAIYITGTAIAV